MTPRDNPWFVQCRFCGLIHHVRDDHDCEERVVSPSVYWIVGGFALVAWLAAIAVWRLL